MGVTWNGPQESREVGAEIGVILLPSRSPLRSPRGSVVQNMGPGAGAHPNWQKSGLCSGVDLPHRLPLLGRMKVSLPRCGTP